MTVIILSTGLGGVFRAYLMSMDYMDYLTTRVYMNFLLDQKLTFMQREFAIRGAVSQGAHTGVEMVEINQEHKLVEFSSRFTKVDELENLVHVALKVTWAGSNRRTQMERHAYLRK